MISLKKISAIAASTLLAGMTMGLAAAASASTTFVDGGSANVAMVYGANALNGDQVAAGNIKEKLTTYVSSSAGTTVSGGDSYLLEKTSTKFNLGDYAGDVVSVKVTDDNLPTLLADGKYTDNDNDEFDYSQTINLENSTLRVAMFEDNDYKADEPTVGIAIANGASVLNYTIDFTDDPLWADLATTDLPLMGKSYYVLDNSSTVGTSLTLLDSASESTLAEGDTKTVNGKEVSVNFISSAEVILDIDGESTNSLAEGQTQKLNDGSYVGIKDILYSSKDTGISKVEFSIGAGKLTLTSGSDVELNDDTISDLTAYISADATHLTGITLQWTADDDLFITEDSSIEMPGFGAVKLAFGGLDYPTTEAIKVEADGDNAIILSNFPLKDSTEDLDILYFNGTNYTLVGKDADNLLATSGNTTLYFDGDTDDGFVVSWNDTQDSESYLMRINNFKNQSGKQMATFQYKSAGTWSDVKVDADPTDTVTLGNVEFDIYSIDKDTKMVTINTSTTGVGFNRIYSKGGMEVTLPYTTATVNMTTNTIGTCVDSNATTAIAAASLGQLIGTLTFINNTDGATLDCLYHPATYVLNLNEQDKNNNLDGGNNIQITLGDDTNDEASVTAVDMGAGEGTSTQIGDSKIYRNFAYSELATEAMWDKTQDQYSVELTYHGEEVTAKVYVTSASATVSTGAADIMIVTDGEVSSVSAKQLVVVGGSCINSVAAQLVGGAYCGDSFADATGVGSGEFLIKGYASGINGRFALLVAGYEVADTTAAATYLIENIGTMDVSKAYKGTTVTSAVTEVTSA